MNILYKLSTTASSALIAGGLLGMPADAAGKSTAGGATSGKVSGTTQSARTSTPRQPSIQQLTPRYDLRPPSIDSQLPRVERGQMVNGIPTQKLPTPVEVLSRGQIPTMYNSKPSDRPLVDVGKGWGVDVGRPPPNSGYGGTVILRRNFP